MKRSELKEIIKSAMMAEGDNYYEDGMDEGDNGIVKRKIGGMSTKLERFRNDAVKDYNNYKYYYKTPEGKWDDLTNLVWKKKVFNAYMSQEGFAKDGMDEGDNYYEDGMDEAKKVEVEDDENIDVDIEKNVKVDDESTESDIEVDTMMPGESETEQAVQGLLLKAQEEAAKLSDEKLTDQIGNTITYFTRAHISQVDEAEDYNSDVADISMDNPAEDAEVGFALEESLRFKKLAGIITEGEYKSRLVEGRLNEKYENNEDLVSTEEVLKVLKPVVVKLGDSSLGKALQYFMSNLKTPETSMKDGYDKGGSQLQSMLTKLKGEDYEASQQFSRELDDAFDTAADIK